jgi:hypothetical protein
MSVKVYIATQMSGRDKAEMVSRAKHVCAVFKQYGIEPISPVIEEAVDDRPGPLLNPDKSILKRLWNRDKYIIRRLAHLVLWDGAEAKSYGCEREYSLNRYCLWKPTVLLVKKHTLSVADFEDDYICEDLHEAAALIRDKWGTWPKRVVWRLKMLRRSLPLWFVDQFYAFF